MSLRQGTVTLLGARGTVSLGVRGKRQRQQLRSSQPYRSSLPPFQKLPSMRATVCLASLLKITELSFAAKSFVVEENVVKLFLHFVLSQFAAKRLGMGSNSCDFVSTVMAIIVNIKEFFQLDSNQWPHMMLNCI